VRVGGVGGWCGSGLAGLGEVSVGSLTLYGSLRLSEALSRSLGLSVPFGCSPALWDALRLSEGL